MGLSTTAKFADGSGHGSPRGSRSKRSRGRRLACCESLEQRQLLTAYFVALTGSDSTGTGTQSNPWRTINHAINAVAAGSTVEVHTGIYREKISLPYHSSTAVTTITTDNSGPVTVEGSDPFTGTWTSDTADSPTAGGSVYYATYTGTSPQEVINGGTWLREIGTESTVYGDSAGGESTGTKPERIAEGSNSVTSMVPNSFYFVPTTGSSSGGTLYIDLPAGASPSADVEISDRDQWLTSATSAQYYTISNINFLYSNSAQDSTSSSTSIPPNALKMPVHGILNNCSLQYADFGAITMASNDTVENCNISYNGDYGIGAGGSTSGLNILDNTISYNNYRHFDVEWQAGGIKLIASGSGGSETGKVFGNTISNNFGDGIWSDSNTANTSTARLLIESNLVANNSPVPLDYLSTDFRVGEAGIKVEVSRYVTVSNNIVSGNYPNGIYVSASQYTDVYNNTIVGNRGQSAVWLGGTPRTLGSTGTNEPLQYDDVENNIFDDNTANYDMIVQANSSSGSTVYAANNTSDHNLFWRFGQPLQFSTAAYGGGVTLTTLSSWTAATGDDADSTDADPHLIAPASGNDQLGSNSPAIRAGATLDLNGDNATTNELDYTGATRVAPFDIGAYKFISGTGVGSNDAAVAIDPNAWVDDTVPTGANVKASAAGGVDGAWNWLSSSTPSDAPVADVPTPAAISGSLSVVPEALSFAGTTAVSFENATKTMAVYPNSDLYAYVYLDPADPPAEVMIQWEASGTWHRACWGANDITSFTSIESDDTGGTTVMAGALPAQSGWVRLEVPASEVGLNTGSNTSPLAVSGLSLDTYGGQAAWDDIGSVVASPVSLWKFDEGAGTIAHDSVGINTGVYKGNANWGTGKSGSDIVLDGASDVDAGHDASLNLASTPTNAAMSISGWFNLSNTGGGTNVSLGADKTGSYRLVAYDADTYENGSASRWQFYVVDSSGTSHTCESTTYFANDVWHYVTGTYDGAGHMNLYVDGTLAASTTWTGTYTLAKTSNDFTIGQRDEIARYFPGQIDELGLYDQVLTQAQIQSVVNSYFAESLTAPAAPANVTASASSAAVQLSWTASSAPTDDAVIYDLYRGTIAGGESATPIAVGLTGTTYTDSSAINGQTYFYTVVAINTGGRSAVSNEVSATPLAAPKVTSVVIGSTAWTQQFLSYLSAQNLGVGGYAVPAGASQSVDLPWVNLNQISITFNQAVNVSQSSLTISGINVPIYAIAGFSYAAAANTATWTLANNIAADSLVMDLSGLITNANGTGLDGAWSDGVSAFPSGNGTAGTNFLFGVNVLPGDVNHDGSVLGNDVLALKPLLATDTTSSNYSFMDDLNGDGSILGNDVLLYRTLLATFLPSAS